MLEPVRSLGWPRRRKLPVLTRIMLTGVVAVGLALSACETAKIAVGITRDVQGQFVALIKPCHPETTVFGWSVTQGTSRTVVWQITSSVGTHQRAFPLGKVPAGFSEVVGYPSQGLVGEVQVVFHTSGLPSDYGNIDLSKVRTGSVLIDGKQVSLDAFNARSVCG